MKSINAKELNELIQRNEVVIIDVREPFEHRSLHIEDSILIPSSDFDAKKIPHSEGKKIVLHCKSGRRSSLILQKLKKDYYNLEGGIDAWVKEGFSAVQSLQKCLPLDRQTQLAVGSLVVVASIFAYFININFIFLTLFIGCGLVFAGLTGFCGLAILIAKAPWNKVYKDCNICSKI